MVLNTSPNEDGIAPGQDLSPRTPVPDNMRTTLRSPARRALSDACEAGPPRAPGQVQRIVVRALYLSHPASRKAAVNNSSPGTPELPGACTE